MYIAVDAARTFPGPLVLMACAPKTKYDDNKAQETTRDGVPKWIVTIAAPVTKFGKPSGTTLEVIVASPTDPAEGIAPPSTVELTNLVVNISEPKVRIRDGQPGVSGGRPYFMADGLRSLAAPAPARSRGDS